MIMLEAMACGCPVVASDVGGVQEIMANGRTGCLYRAGDVQGAVAAALRLMNERDYRDAVVSAAMDYVHASHTLARAAEAYLVVLDEVGALSGRGAPNDQARPDAHAGDLVEATHTPSLARNLMSLFSEKVLVGVRRTVVPYHDVVPRVQLGFEPAATVELEMRPKDDFSRSPDQCLNTLVLDYQGQVMADHRVCLHLGGTIGVERYQVGIARPDRPLRCRVVLRIRMARRVPGFPLCNWRSQRGARHGRGRLGLPTSVVPTSADRRSSALPRCRRTCIWNRLSDGLSRVTSMRWAIAFVTMERPTAAQRFVQSARRVFPDAPMYVADQSRTLGFMAEFYEAERVTVVRMPFDAGLSASRNALVEAMDVDYFALCDDDFVLGPATSFGSAINVLEEDAELGVVGGLLHERDGEIERIRNWEMFFDHDESTADSRRRYTTIRRSRGTSPADRLPLRRVMNFAVFAGDVLFRCALGRTHQDQR
jgi:hypothetical protein